MAKISVNLPIKLRAYYIIRKLLIGFILASMVNFVFSYFFHTPKVFRLSRENTDLVIKYKLLHNRITNSKDKLLDIRNRDNGIYRSIFAADTLPIVALESDIYHDKYLNMRQNRFTPLVENTWKDLDIMRDMLYTQSLSLDTLQLLAKDKEKMAESVPAILPLNKHSIRGHVGSYGNRVHPIFRFRHNHTGIDLAGNPGTPIYTTADGKVVSSGRDGNYGISVLINHGYGYQTRYAHLRKSLVTAGQAVKRGENIAELGNTGNSTGPHLHYEVLYRGKPVNPINYFTMDMNDDDYKRIIESAKDITYER